MRCMVVIEKAYLRETSVNVHRNSAFILRLCRLRQTQNRGPPKLLLKARRRHPELQQEDALDPVRQKV